MSDVYDLLEHLRDGQTKMVPLELEVFCKEACEKGWIVNCTTMDIHNYRAEITRLGVSALLNRPEVKGRKVGRPKKKDQADTSADCLVVSALALHHEYQQGGSIGNDAPATGPMLERLVTGLSRVAVKRFLDRKFRGTGGWKGYRAACHSRDIGKLLAAWQGDINPDAFGPIYDEQPEDKEPDY